MKICLFFFEPVGDLHTYSYKFPFTSKKVFFFQKKKNKLVFIRKVWDLIDILLLIKPIINSFILDLANVQSTM